MNKVKQIDWSKYTDFQQKVYRVILQIPKGQVLTYSEVARRTGNRQAARAVGNALAANLDAPIIPCHRVVGYNNIGGYSARGGVKRKLMILKKEGFRYE